MGQVKKMQSVIADLKSCSDYLASLAEELTEMFFGGTEAVETSHEEQSKLVKAPEKELKLEDVRAVLAEKSRRGLTEKVRALIEKHGADRLSAVDSKDYPALLAEAEDLHDD